MRDIIIIFIKKNKILLISLIINLVWVGYFAHVFIKNLFLCGLVSLIISIIITITIDRLSLNKLFINFKGFKLFGKFLFLFITIITAFILITLLIPHMYTFDRIYSWKAQNVTVDVVSEGQKNLNAQSTEVWITNFTVDDNSVNLASLSKQGEWEIKYNMLGSYQKQPSKISWSGIVNKSINITFQKHPWSGKVNIFFNGNRISKDLYSSSFTGTNVTFNLNTLIPLKLVALLIICLILGSKIFELYSYIWDKFNSPGTRLNRFLFYFIPCIIVWGVYLLAFYPGLMTNDSYTQWHQIITGNFTDSMPIVHTLLIWILTRFYNSPVIIAIVQLLYMSIIFAIVMSTMERQCKVKFLPLIILVFFILLPINGLYVITLWKDILYSISILLLTFILYLIFSSNGNWLSKKRNIGLLIFALLTVMLFRHNGILPAFVSIILLFFIFKNKRVLSTLIFAIMILVLLFVKIPLANMLNVKPMVNWAGGVLPIHQISYFVNQGVQMGKEDIKLLEKIAPIKVWKECYNPYVVDPLGWNKEFNGQKLSQNLSEFMNLWGKLAIKHPILVLNEWKSITSMIWEIYQPSGGYIYTGPLGGLEPNDLNIKRASLLPNFQQELTKILVKTEERSYNWFFWRPALYFYIILVCSFVYFRKTGWKSIIILVPVFFNTAGLALTLPGQDIRYLYPVFLVIPIFILLAFSKEGEFKLKYHKKKQINLEDTKINE